MIRYLLALILTTGLGLVACEQQTKSKAAEDSQEQASAPVEDDGLMTLSIRIKQPQQGPVLLQRQFGQKLLTVDTIAANSAAQLQKTIQVPDKGIYTLNLANQQYVNLVITGEDLSVEAEGTNMAAYSYVSGSIEMDRFNEAMTMLRDFQSSSQEMQQQFQTAATSGQDAQARQLSEVYQQMVETYQQDMQSLIRSWGASITGIYLLQALPKYPEYDYLQHIEAAFKAENKTQPKVVTDFLATVDKLRITSIGQVAPEIELAAPGGELVALSSLRGQYVLIDFWASWCKPCRIENPNTVRAYQAYKAKGFEVYAVSLDKDRQRWLRAIEEDNLTWLHVSDLQFWSSAAAKDYGVGSIPATFLIDPEGKIVAKDLRGFALQQKLQQLLDT